MKDCITFNYIRNKISQHSKGELLHHSTQLLKQVDLEEKQTALWDYLLLVKWIYLYAQEQAPFKPLTPKLFQSILKSIEIIQDKSLKNVINDNNDWDSFFQILSYQQFYLQEDAYWDDFARQTCLYRTIFGRYDINNSFEKKTGLTIIDFLSISLVFWCYIKSPKSNEGGFYNGYINHEDLPAFNQLLGENKVLCYLKLLTITPANAENQINNYKKSLKSGDLQPFEVSVFTMFPFQELFGKLNIIHSSVFSQTCCHFIYDFLKQNDAAFTTEFGGRFEKYIELGLKEINANYLTESALKRRIGRNEKVADYLVNDYLIIECKAIEQKPIAGINPFNEVAYSSLKDSIIKAYTKQILNVAAKFNMSVNSFGFIITYREFYYSSMSDLENLIKDDIDRFLADNNLKENPLPPKNVFVISIRTWDRLIQLLKDGKGSFKGILEAAVRDNQKGETKLKSFNLHLNKYKMKEWSLSYLHESYALIKKYS